MPVESRNSTLRKMLTAIPKEEQSKILSRILTLPKNAEQRVRLLVDLAPFLPEPLLEEVLSSVLTLSEDNDLQVSLLVDLVPYLPKSSLEKVLLSARRFRDPEKRARLLMGLVPLFSGTEREVMTRGALKSIRRLEDDERRFELLANLASLLPQALQEQDISDILAFEIERLQKSLASEEATVENRLTLSIKITQTPLATQNLAVIVSSLTDLHTRCWLIQRHRFADLMDYTQTYDSRFVKEANLRIVRMTYKSPALIDFLVGSASIAGTATLALALKTAIDAIIQTPLRFRATQLKNQREELEQKIRVQEARQAQQIEAQKADAENRAALQDQQLAAQKAQVDLERQLMFLDLTKQQVEVEKQQLDLERQRLALEKDRVQIILEMAKTMVGQLQPDADMVTREMLMHSLVPSLLQLATSDGLELAEPVPQKNEETEKPSENG